MPKLMNITGRRFGRLVVIKRAANTGSVTRWRCQCDCGKQSIVRARDLITGKTKSCGCGRQRNLTGQRFGRLIALTRVSLPLALSMRLRKYHFRYGK
jgi:hypothetical protein